MIEKIAKAFAKTCEMYAGNGRCLECGKCEDCLKEGIEKMITGCEYYQYAFYDNGKSLWHNYKTPKEAFAHLINKVSRKDVWSLNPYVFVYDFELIK